MPLSKGSEKANLKLLAMLKNYAIDQQQLLNAWTSGSYNKHQLAICFDFPPDFQIAFGPGVQQGSGYGERVMRLCESVNQPDTIKADLFTRTPNNGTLAGVQPGIEVLGTPIPPELFLAKVGFVLVAMVHPGDKHKGPFTGAFAFDKPIFTPEVIEQFTKQTEQYADMTSDGVVGAFKKTALGMDLAKEVKAAKESDWVTILDDPYTDDDD